MKNLDQERFEKLVRNFVHHKGLGGEEAHPPVDGWDSGFMTPGMLKDLKNSLGNATFLPNNTDVMTLNPGNYITWSKDTSRSNLPTNTGFLVQIAKGDKIKTIRAWDFGKGKEYVYNLNFSGDQSNLPSGWSRVYHEKVLWDKPFFGKGTSVTLAERADLFEDIIVIFRHNQQNDSVAFLSSWNLVQYGLSVSATNISTTNDTLMVGELLLKVDKETAKNFTISDVRCIALGRNFFSDATNVDKMEVIKIIGRY